jgi:ubiquinone biosynthesis O-methyltransferase
VPVVISLSEVFSNDAPKIRITGKSVSIHEMNCTATFNSNQHRAYLSAVLGSERAKHTYRRRLETIQGLANGLSGKRVLDVGCGYGFRTLGLASKGAEALVGIDLDRNRVSAAIEYARHIEINSITFQVMNAQRMEFEENAFDVVVADEMIHHVENLPAVIREMYRVTKQNGITVISDHNKWSIPSQVLRSIYFRKDKQRVFSARQVQGFLEKVGYRNVTYKYILFTLPFHKIPRPIFSLNRMIESMIEKTPLLRLQCGVYVIRGFK